MPSRYSFFNPLTRDAAEAALLLPNRTLLHRAAAQALSAEHTRGVAGESELLTRLARHWELAGDAAQAHAVYCQALEARAGAGLFSRWSELSRLAATAWSLAHPDMPPAAEGSARFLNAQAARDLPRGKLSRALSRSRQALALATSPAEAGVAARALFRCGSIRLTRGAVERAETDMRRALQLASSAGLQYLRGEILIALARLLLETSRFDEACQILDEAVAAFEADANLRGLALTRMSQAVLERMTGNNDGALACNQLALDLARGCGNRLVEGWLLGNIGNRLGEAGQYTAAEEHIRQALELMRQTGDRVSRALFLGNLGVFYGLQGKYSEQRACLEEALAEHRTLGDQRPLAMTLANLGSMHRRLGELARSVEYLNEAQRLFSDLGDKLSLVWTLGQSAETAIAMQDVPAARGYLLAAEAVGLEGSSAPELGLIKARWAQVLAAEGRASEAADALAESVRLADEGGEPDESDLRRAIREARRAVQDAAGAAYPAGPGAPARSPDLH